MIIDKIWKTIFSYLPTQKPTVINNTVHIDAPVNKSSIIRASIIKNIPIESIPHTTPNTIKIGTLISPEQIKLMSPSCDYEHIAPALNAAAKQYGIVTPRQIRHWISHLCVESGYFLHFEENLNYSANRLTQVWPNRFPTLHDAEAYANNPRLLGNKVYGGRMGNTGQTDGYNYRGRGFIQLTGKDNYAKAGKAIGVDLVVSPDYAANYDVAANIAGWYWKLNNLNAIVAKDANEIPIKGATETINIDIIKIMRANEEDDLIQGTKAINGGLIGLKERRMELWKAMFIWRD